MGSFYSKLYIYYEEMDQTFSVDFIESKLIRQVKIDILEKPEMEGVQIDQLHLYKKDSLYGKELPDIRTLGECALMKGNIVASKVFDSIKLPKFPQKEVMDMNAPYVVLIGDAGAGKSTLVEKISRFKNLSSDSCISATRSSTCFPSYDYHLLISDTPGKNPMDEIFEHNIDTAYAMTLKPVSSLIIVAEAHTRIDKTIDG